MRQRLRSHLTYANVISTLGSGIYKVRFNGIATQLALGSVIEGGDNFCTDNFVSVTKLGSFTNASEFYVYSRDNDGDLQDCWVTVAAI